VIESDRPSGNILHIVIPEKLDIDDFDSIKNTVDQMIIEHGKIRLLLDAEYFH